MNAPTTAALHWHDEADLLGVRVRVFFFDPAEVDPRTDFVGRQLPILRGTAARLLSPEDQRDTYRVGALQARPDAVLAHGKGLLSLNFEGGDGRLFDATRWRQQWRADVMLQAIACAMAVAGQCQLPTAALWRGANLLCQFDPSPPVLEWLATSVAAAQQYWNGAAQVSADQLASFCEPRLRMLPGLAAEPALTA
jgi:hypothetical protein